MSRTTAQLNEVHLESLATLAGGVAHEFNNVLTIVLGYGGLIPDLADDPERLRQTVDHIMKAARRGADVVYQLQLFARTQECPRSLQDIHQLVRDSVVHTARGWPATVNVHLLLAAGPILLPVNAAQLILALQHLLQNAREALLLDTGHITVRTTLHLDQQPPSLCLGIEDNGIGMAPAVRERVCEPFFTRHATSGIRGLGLSVVHGIVHAHGGRLEVDAPPEGGARVRLWLPLETSASSPDGSEAISASAGEPTALAVARDYAGIIAP
ncbi:MAG: ATP-binding protein [Rariglobus sp.]